MNIEDELKAIDNFNNMKQNKNLSYAENYLKRKCGDKSANEMIRVSDKFKQIYSKSPNSFFNSSMNNTITMKNALRAFDTLKAFNPFSKSSIQPWIKDITKSNYIRKYINNVSNYINAVSLFDQSNFNSLGFKHMISVELRSIDRIKLLFPTHLNYLKKIGEMGWTFIDYDKFPSINLMNNRMKLSDSDLNNLFSNVLIKNNYKLMKEIFDDLINNLDSGHAKQILILKKIILKNKSYYILSFGILFPILEYLWTRRYKKHFNNRTLNIGEIDSNKSKVLKNAREHKDLSELLKLNELIVIGVLYRSVKFGNYDNYKDVPYSRHSIAHGLYDPNNFKFSYFLKLLLICRNEAVYSNDSKL